MSQYLDSLIVEKTFTPTAVQFATATQALANSTLTLVVTSPSHQFFTGSTVGQIVQLPDATTLAPGWMFEFYNQGSTTLAVKDGSGAALFTLGQSSIGFMKLQLNGTAAGTWIFYQQFVSSIASGIQSYNITSTTSFTNAGSADVLITGMTVTPAAGTYAIWFNCQVTAGGSGQQMDVSVYNGGSLIADSKRSNLATAGIHIFQPNTQTISQFTGSSACEVRVNPNGNSQTVGARSMLLIRLGN